MSSDFVRFLSIAGVVSGYIAGASTGWRGFVLSFMCGYIGSVLYDVTYSEGISRSIWVALCATVCVCLSGDCINRTTSFVLLAIGVVLWCMVAHSAIAKLEAPADASLPNVQ